jgi:hypothetical protein
VQLLSHAPGTESGELPRVNQGWWWFANNEFGGANGHKLYGYIDRQVERQPGRPMSIDSK